MHQIYARNNENKYSPQLAQNLLFAMPPRDQTILSYLIGEISVLEKLLTLARLLDRQNHYWRCTLSKIVDSLEFSK